MADREGRFVAFEEFNRDTTFKRTMFYDLISRGVLVEAGLTRGDGKRAEKKLVTRESYNRWLNGEAPKPRERKGVVARLKPRPAKRPPPVPSQRQLMRVPHFR